MFEVYAYDHAEMHGRIVDLNTRSVFFVVAAVSFALSIIFLSLKSVTPRYHGFNRWALSNGFIGMAFLVLSTNQNNLLFAAAANTLIIGGVCFLSNGIWAFLDRPSRFEPLAFLPVFVALPLFLFFSLVRPDSVVRIIILSGILTVQFAACAVIVLYRYPFTRKTPSRLTAGVFICLAAWFAYGCMAVLSRQTLHSESVLLMAVGIVTWTLGLGIMTAMRLAEELEAHEQEESRLRREVFVKMIIDTVPQSIILKDTESRYIACNEAFAKSVNRDKDQIAGLTDRDLYPAEFADKYRQDDKEVMAGRTTREFIERYLENNRELWIETIKTPLIGPEGKCEGIIVSFRDITERKMDQEQLQESERRYRELSEQLETRVTERTAELERAKRDSDLFFEVTLDYLCLADFSGRFLKLSPSWTKNLGWRENELMNRTFLDFIHHDDRHETILSARELAHGGRIQDKANRFLRADGSWVWLSWSAVGLPDRGIVLAAAHDVTARVETEEHLRNAREVAEAASRAKSQFISTMSHELRTPLNAVLGYARLLAPLIHDKQGERYISSIESSGRALLAIINDLLDLTKVESGRLELTLAPFEPRKLMDEIAEIFRFGAEGKVLYIEFRSSSCLPKTLLMDGPRLRQILINLIGNSIKFTEEGTIGVYMDASEPASVAVEDGTTMYTTTIFIRVEDTGIGMSESYRSRLFEPFSQQDAGIARKYGGTGLGLAIAKRLLDLMNGSISCESEPNRGTRFLIEIPGVRAAGREPEVISFIGGSRTSASS